MEEEVHIREPCHLCDQTSLNWNMTGVDAPIHIEYDYFIVVVFFFLPNKTCCAEV
jgi:hypothetical protein